jgi:hypothetical protein
MANRITRNNSILATCVIISSILIGANNKKRDSIIINDTNPSDIYKSLVVFVLFLLNTTISTTPRNMDMINLPTKYRISY